jgi:hypothetical protein
MGVFRVVAALACLGGAAQAEMLDHLDRVETPVGPVLVVSNEDGYSQRVIIGEQSFLDDGDYRFVSIRAREGSLYLLELSTGGNGCAAEYAWLHAVPGDVRLSPVFGNCSDLAEVSADAETVTVTLPALDAATGRTAFVYDGQTVTERPAGQTAADVAPGAGADALVGTYPFDLFRTADWRAPLVALLGEAAYAQTGTLFELAAPMEIEGDWVTGSGCVKFACSDRTAAVAVHRRDGRILVALRDGLLVGIYGDPGGDLPPAIARVLQGTW